MTDRIIMLRYSCPLCGLRDAETPVPARQEQDAAVWLDQTIRELARDHAARSPRCRAHQLRDIKIPIEGADRLGGPVQG